MFPAEIMFWGVYMQICVGLLLLSHLQTFTIYTELHRQNVTSSGAIEK